MADHEMNSRELFYYLKRTEAVYQLSNRARYRMINDRLALLHDGKARNEYALQLVKRAVKRYYRAMREAAKAPGNEIETRKQEALKKLKACLAPLDAQIRQVDILEVQVAPSGEQVETRRTVSQLEALTHADVKNLVPCVRKAKYAKCQLILAEQSEHISHVGGAWSKRIGLYRMMANGNLLQRIMAFFGMQMQVHPVLTAGLQGVVFFGGVGTVFTSVTSFASQPLVIRVGIVAGIGIVGGIVLGYRQSGLRWASRIFAEAQVDRETKDRPYPVAKSYEEFKKLFFDPLIADDKKMP